MQRNRIRLIFAGCFLFASTVCLEKALRYLQYRQMNYEISKETKSIITKHELSETLEPQGFSHESWEELKSINEDFIGFLMFDEGFIEQPIVRGDDNDYYLQHDFHKNWNLFGSIYMDYENDIDSQNIILYGHNVFFSENEMFSPLLSLINQETYEDHKSFRIYFENDVVEYCINAIYYYDINDDRSFDYRQYVFSQNELQDYINYAYSHNLINSNTSSIQKTERIITLQTCKDLNSTVRILFLCSEINRTKY